MSDFVNEFWNWYIAIIVVVSIIACAVFLWVQGANRSGSSETVDTTGHVWDETLKEYNNPLPRWWMWVFYLTVVFSLAYVVIYPALGRFAGTDNWTSTGAYVEEVKRAEEKMKPLFDKYMAMDLHAVAKDKEAMEMGNRLFQTYCMQCHGANGQGARGFPNLTDKDWQWGGTPEEIVKTITEGRKGKMEPYGGNPEAVGGPEGAREVANYVRSLSGLKHDEKLVASGKERYNKICFACHGMDGKGMQALGAPNLTDKVWLYGSSEDRLVETIVNGRNNEMPAWGDFLGKQKIHLLAAYVVFLSGGGEVK